MGFFGAWRGLRAYRRLAPEWRRIVFYAETGQDWHHFEPLIDTLVNRHHRRVTYVSSDPADPGLAPRDGVRGICIPEGLFLTVHFQTQRAGLVVLTMMDLDNFHLKRSLHPVHYVYLFHGMGSTHMVDHANSYDAYDSLFCVGPHQVAELRAREQQVGLEPRHLFEYGHPRLEELHREATAAPVTDTDETTVLVAPTWGADSIFNRVGAPLLRTLLEAGMRVIMRPHYQTRRQSPEVIDSLLREFSAHERFEYVDRMGENASLFRSDLLVSDWSAMAIEYALALEKPVLFIDLPRRVRNPDWQALGIEPIEAAIRPQVGRVLAPDHLGEAPSLVRELLRDRGQFRARMQALRERLVFNFGASVPAGAAELARLADEVANG